MKQRKMSVPVVLLYAVAALLMVYVIWMYGFHSPREAGLGEGKKAIANFPWTAWEIMLYAHILTGSVALLIGPFQFLKRSYQKNLALHRKLGKLYVMAIFLSVPCGVYVALYATGGLSSTISFLGLDVAWFYTTYMALKRVRQRNIQAHLEWMHRSYAMTWVFVTFRVLVVIPSVLGLDASVAFPLAVWSSILLNLGVTQFILKKKRKHEATGKAKAA